MVLVLVYGTLAITTRQYAPVWHDEFSVWQRAEQLAPRKPRVLNNYAVMLVAKGRFDEARQMFARAHASGHAADLPKWDNVEGELRSRENLVALDTLIAQIRR